MIPVGSFLLLPSIPLWNVPQFIHFLTDRHLLILRFGTLQIMLFRGIIVDVFDEHMYTRQVSTYTEELNCES